MVDLKKMREAAVREAMKLMASPRVMKVMSNPRVMKVMMQAFQLRGNVQQAVDARLKQLARRLKLATRDDVREMQSTIRDLEAQLRSVQHTETNGAAKHA